MPFVAQMTVLIYQFSSIRLRQERLALDHFGSSGEPQLSFENDLNAVHN